jgi:hypothetical protein
VYLTAKQAYFLIEIRVAGGEIGTMPRFDFFGAPAALEDCADGIGLKGHAVRLRLLACLRRRSMRLCGRPCQ